MTTPIPICPLRNRRRQRGAAILIMTLILMLGLITLFTFRMERRAPELEADRKTAMALAQAKEALLGRAASNNDPGTLPCPDFNGDGLLTIGLSGDYSGPDCGAYLGWLPWASLDLGELQDGNNGKLWYLLSVDFKDNGNFPTPAVMGTLSISGVSPQNNLVAIIVAPGRPVSNQSQPAANATGYLQYLESYVNGTTLNSVVPGSNYNDRFMGVTWSELFTVVTTRAARSFAKELTLPHPPSNWVPNTGEWVANQPFFAWANPGVTVYNQPVAVGSPAILRFPPCATIFSIQGVGPAAQISRSGSC